MESQKLKTALADHQQGKLKRAEQSYLTIIDEEPENADALHLLAILYGQLKQFELALPYMERALIITPTSPTYHNSMGNIKKHLNDVDGAMRHYQEALTLDPNSVGAHNNLASIYLQRDHFDEAIEQYQKALALDPDFVDSNYNLALAYHNHGDADQAKKYFTHVIEINDEHFQSLAGLGSIAFQEGHVNEAIKYLEKSVKLYDRNIEALVNLGAALVKKGKFEDALGYFNKAIKLDPKHFEAHYNLGCTYLNLRKPKEAQQHFLRILSKDPNPEVYYNIGVIYMYQDRHSEAISYLQEAIKFKPDYLDAIVNLGVTFLKMEHHDKAIENFEKALALDPNNQEVQYILSALQGDQVPQRAPEQYVRHLFDQYADYYEKHLLEFLHYDTHNLLFKAVKEVLGDKFKDLLIVDLGCGTGLTGELFKLYSRKMIGIDLSVKMVGIAGNKNIYDDLHIADIHTTLKSINDADLILAGDVISYLGDLSETFSLCSKALKNQGYFAFSAEVLDDAEQDFQLQKTARFKHNQHYIEKLASDNNLTSVYQKKVTLRQQKNQPVDGIIFVLQKVG